MRHFIPTNLNYDFLKISKPFIWASTIAVIGSLLLLTVGPGLNLGIDFTGGAEVSVQVPDGWDTTELRNALDAGGISNAVIVTLDDGMENQFLIKVQAEPEELSLVSNRVDQAMIAAAGADNFTMLSSDMVGPAAGDRLKRSALLSMFYAAIGILIYITLRFDIRFAPGIIRALVFDVIIVLGIWVLIGKEFTLAIVAALLTIAGYSCNDTIVIYDRIREYSRLHPNWKLDDIINKAINLNLERTILTTVSTLFVVLSLWFLGGPVLADFAFAMLIGFAISVASTIFIASPMVLFMEKRRLAKMAARS